jgi:UTP--glucose-1-phosphate uridylyltransferase
MKITKAIIPVAGKGTRFLPASKELPKEMLPILNFPMIHYVVKEAVDSGIEEIIFVTSTGKESIENYFDRNFELEMFLEKAGKHESLELIQNIGKMVNIRTVRQKEQLGLGHAVLMGKSGISDGERFAVLLGDDIIVAQTPATKQLMEISKARDNSSVIAVMEVANEETAKYGIVAGEKLDDKTLKMTEMVEKPKPQDAPTNLATPGRYILSKEIFDILEEIPKGAGGEYQLTDAINVLANRREVFAHIFDGERFDTGSVKGYLDATMDFALRDPNLKEYALKLMEEKITKFKG